MKKYLLTIILFILIIPTVVIAGTCNPSDIVIETVTLSKTVGTSEEVTAASVENKSINLDVKLNNPSDYMEYTITVRNDGTEDYYIKETDFNNNQYLKYEFVHENSSFKILPGEEKTITLRVSYQDRVEGSANYTTTDSLSLNILDKQDIAVANTLRNISIVAVILIAITIISIFIGGGILINNKSKNLLLILVGILLIIPMYVNASCDAKIDVDVKVELDSKNAMFDTGRAVNKKIKTLAGHTYNNSKQPWNPENKDENITSFIRSTTEPATSNKETKNIVSSQDSELPIYMWYESGTLYWWSEDETPSLNPDSGCFLTNLTKLENIDTIQYFDVSTAVDLSDFFEELNTISDISAVANWNVSNVINITYLLCDAYGLTNIDALANWDTSKVESIEGLLCYAEYIEDISGIANWNISSLNDMSCAFEGCMGLQDISPLSNWDVSKVTFFIGVFDDAENLSNFIPIKDWDLSSAKDISVMFDYCISLSDISFLADWDVSNVENMSCLFSGCTILSSIDALAGWNTSNVTNISYMFYKCTSLASIEPLRNWDVSKVTNMKDLFYYCSALTSVEPIEGWTTTSLEDMTGAFANITKMPSIDLTHWDVSKVTDMTDLFADCYALKNIDLTGWNTSNVTSMAHMFNTISASVLDLSSFDTRNVTSFKRMFNGSSNLQTIYIGENWNTSANTGETIYVFNTTTNLPNFSSENQNYRDLIWAKPTTQGGYLTIKPNE